MTSSSSSFSLQDRESFNEHQVLLSSHQWNMDRHQDRDGSAYEIRPVDQDERKPNPSFSSRSPPPHLSDEVPRSTLTWKALSKFDYITATPTEGSVWTFSARIFIISIAGFDLVTVSMLAAAMRLQALAAKSLESGFNPNSRSIEGSIFYTAHLLQAQSIVCELVLLGAAYFAIVTQNLVAVLAVLLFNIYLVIGGFIEAGQRNYLLANDNGPELATVRRILWAIPAIDICFHFGSDWAAFRLYKELGWTAYKKSSADVAIGGLQPVLILRATSFFSTVFILISFTSTLIILVDWIALFLTETYKVPRLPPAALEVLLPSIFSIVLFFGALVLLRMGVKAEGTPLVWASIGLQVAALALHLTAVGIFAPVLRLTSELIADLSETSVSKAGALSNEWKVFFQFAISTVLLLGNLVMTGLVLRGFGKGLKERETQLANPGLAQELDLFD